MYNDDAMITNIANRTIDDTQNSYITWVNAIHKYVNITDILGALGYYVLTHNDAEMESLFSALGVHIQENRNKINDYFINIEYRHQQVEQLKKEYSHIGDQIQIILSVLKDTKKSIHLISHDGNEFKGQILKQGSETDRIIIYKVNNQYYGPLELNRIYSSIDHYSTDISLKLCNQQIMRSYCIKLLLTHNSTKADVFVTSLINKIISFDDLVTIYNELLLYDKKNFFLIKELIKHFDLLEQLDRSRTINEIKRVLVRGLGNAFITILVEEETILREKSALQQKKIEKDKDELLAVMSERDALARTSKINAIRAALEFCCADYNVVKKFVHTDAISKINCIDDIFNIISSCHNAADLNLLFKKQQLTDYELIQIKDILKEQLKEEQINPIYLSQDEKNKSIVLSITGLHLCISQLLQNPKFLNAYKNSDIKIIKIEMEGTLFFDVDLVLPGKNLIVLAQKIEVTHNVCINLSGEKGTKFTLNEKKAKSGAIIRQESNKAQLDEPDGQKGADGDDGNSGENAGNLHIQAMNITNSHLIKIIANGGKGAKGQHGGNGDNGKKGTNGIDGKAKDESTLLCLGQNANFNNVTERKDADPGGPGGDGGNGGAGGIGGNAGAIKIIINNQIIIDDNDNKEDKELFRDEKTGISVIKKKGRDGNPGDVGKGGSGGEGGLLSCDEGYQWGFLGRGSTKKRGWLALIPRKSWFRNYFELDVLTPEEKILKNKAKSGIKGKDGIQLSKKKITNKTTAYQEFLSLCNYSYKSMSSPDNSELNSIDIKLNYLASKIQNIDENIRNNQEEQKNLSASLDAITQNKFNIHKIVQQATETVEKTVVSESCQVKSIMPYYQKASITDSKISTQVQTTALSINQIDTINKTQDKAEEIVSVSSIILYKYKDILSGSELESLEYLLVKLKNVLKINPSFYKEVINYIENEMVNFVQVIKKHKIYHQGFFENIHSDLEVCLNNNDAQKIEICNELSALYKFNNLNGNLFISLVKLRLHICDDNLSQIESRNNKILEINKINSPLVIYINNVIESVNLENIIESVLNKDKKLDEQLKATYTIKFKEIYHDIINKYKEKGIKLDDCAGRLEKFRCILAKCYSENPEDIALIYINKLIDVDQIKVKYENFIQRNTFFEREENKIAKLVIIILKELNKKPNNETAFEAMQKLSVVFDYHDFSVNILDDVYLKLQEILQLKESFTTDKYTVFIVLQEQILYQFNTNHMQKYYQLIEHRIRSISMSNESVSIISQCIQHLSSDSIRLNFSVRLEKLNELKSLIYSNDEKIDAKLLSFYKKNIEKNIYVESIKKSVENLNEDVIHNFNLSKSSQSICALLDYLSSLNLTVIQNHEEKVLDIILKISQVIEHNNYQTVIAYQLLESLIQLSFKISSEPKLKNIIHSLNELEKIVWQKSIDQANIIFDKSISKIKENIKKLDDIYYQFEKVLKSIKFDKNDIDKKQEYLKKLNYLHNRSKLMVFICLDETINGANDIYLDGLSKLVIDIDKCASQEKITVKLSELFNKVEQYNSDILLNYLRAQSTYFISNDKFNSIMGNKYNPIALIKIINELFNSSQVGSYNLRIFQLVEIITLIMFEQKSNSVIVKDCNNLITRLDKFISCPNFENELHTLNRIKNNINSIMSGNSTHEQCLQERVEQYLQCLNFDQEEYTNKFTSAVHKVFLLEGIDNIFDVKKKRTNEIDNTRLIQRNLIAILFKHIVNEKINSDDDIGMNTEEAMIDDYIFDKLRKNNVIYKDFSLAKTIELLFSSNDNLDVINKKLCLIIDYLNNNIYKINNYKDISNLLCELYSSYKQAVKKNYYLQFQICGTIITTWHYYCELLIGDVNDVEKALILQSYIDNISGIYDLFINKDKYFDMLDELIVDIKLANQHSVSNINEIIKNHFGKINSTLLDEYIDDKSDDVANNIVTLFQNMAQCIQANGDIKNALANAKLILIIINNSSLNNKTITEVSKKFVMSDLLNILGLTNSSIVMELEELLLEIDNRIKTLMLKNCNNIKINAKFYKRLQESQLTSKELLTIFGENHGQLGPIETIFNINHKINNQELPLSDKKQLFIEEISKFLLEEEGDLLQQIVAIIETQNELDKLYELYQKLLSGNCAHQDLIFYLFQNIYQKHLNKIGVSVNELIEKFITLIKKANVYGENDDAYRNIEKYCLDLLNRPDFDTDNSAMFLSLIASFENGLVHDHELMSNLSNFKAIFKGIFNFQYFYSSSFSLVKNNLCINEWINLNLYYLENRTHSTHNIADELNKFSRLFKYAYDELQIEKISATSERSLSEHWTENVLYDELRRVISVLFGIAQQEKENEYKISVETAENLAALKTNINLLDLLLAKLRDDVNLVDKSSAITERSFSLLVNKLRKTKIDENVLAYLKDKPIADWCSSLKQINIYRIAVRALFKIKNNLKQNEIDSFISDSIKACYYADAKNIKRLLRICINKLATVHDLNIVRDIFHNIIMEQRFLGNDLVSQFEKTEISGWAAIYNKYYPVDKDEVHSLDALLHSIRYEKSHKENAEDNSIIFKELKLQIDDLEKKYTEQYALWLKPPKLLMLLTQEEFLGFADYINKNGGAKWVRENILYVITVIRHAVEKLYSTKDSQFNLHHTQILALLLLINNQDKQRGGCLGQVATGEGKTLITAMFAILQALSGHKVNVVTSSSVLAIRDAEENVPLYKLFGLSVSNNCDKAAAQNHKERQQRYQSYIVYGDIGSFQRDILLSKYLDIDVLGNRENEILVVDEVDSMLLDKGENTHYLSHDIADLRSLRRLYVEIWCYVNAKGIAQSNTHIINTIQDQIQNKIKNGDILIPESLHEFVTDRLSLWIESAFIAKNIVVDDPYSINNKNNNNSNSEDDIVLMDKDTGVELLDTEWHGGVQQFLQLKHCRKFTPESLKAIYMSNCSFFQRYRGNIYGLTGTLGNKVDKSLLKQMYGIDAFFLPRHKKYLFQEETGIIQDNSTEWLEEIKKDVEAKIKAGRPVLIICENKKKVKQINDYLTKEFDKYTYDSSFTSFKIGNKDNPLKSGQVIIATNLAGRGTDLLTSKEVEEKGGLHIILSYLPKNARVERQAFGRTARKGNKGTGRCIIEVYPNQTKDLEILRHERDIAESKRLENIRTTKVQAIYVEEELLKKFMGSYQEIKKTIMAKTEKIYGKEYVDIELMALKNRWAFWLDSMSDDINDVVNIGKDAIYQEYEYFIHTMQTCLENNEIFTFCHSPHELNSLGKYLVKYGKYDDAIKCFDKIIEKYPNHCDISYYYKVYAMLLKNSAPNRQERKLIDKLFKQSEIQFQQRINELRDTTSILDAVVKLTSDAGQGQFSNAYRKQAYAEIEIYQLLIANIKDATGNNLTEFMLNNNVPEALKQKSHTLYENIVKDQSFIKPWRINKKVKFKIENDNFVFHTDQRNNSISVSLPVEFNPVKEDLQKYFDSKLSATDASAQSHKYLEMDINSFCANEKLLNLESLWAQLKEYKYIEVSSEKQYRININPEHLSQIDLTHSQAAEIKSRLINNHGQMILLSNFSGLDINEEYFQNLKKSLLQFNLLREVEVGTLKIPVDDKGKMQLPSNLKPYQLMFESAVTKDKYKSQVTAQNNLVLTNWCFDEISLPLNADESKKKLILFLLEHEIIKYPKVAFSFSNSDSQSTIEKRLNEIKEKLTKHIKEVFGDDAEQCLKTISDAIEKIIGKFKTLSDFSVSVENLEKFFMEGIYPPELKQFQSILLDEVLVFEQRISRWNWGAFTVAMLGLAQIAAGIALGVFTYGFGSIAGLALVNEGIGDIIFAVQSGLSGQFSWKSYGIHKAVSLVMTSISLLIMGIPIGFAAGINASKDVLINTLKFTLGVAAIEGAKAVGGRLASMGLEWLVGKLPQEIQLHLGSKIKNLINDSEKMKQALQTLNKTMEEVFKTMDHSENAKDCIKNVFQNAIKFPDENENIVLLKTIALNMAQDIPSQILLQSNTSTGLVLASAVGLIVQGIASSWKLYNIVTLTPTLVEHLNKKLQDILEKTKQEKKDHINNKQLSESDITFISEQIDNVKEDVTQYILTQITHEVLKPGILHGAQMAVNSIGNKLMKTMQSANDERFKQLKTAEQEDSAISTDVSQPSDTQRILNQELPDIADAQSSTLAPMGNTQNTQENQLDISTNADSNKKASGDISQTGNHRRGRRNQNYSNESGETSVNESADSSGRTRNHDRRQYVRNRRGQQPDIREGILNEGMADSPNQSRNNEHHQRRWKNQSRERLNDNGSNNETSGRHQWGNHDRFRNRNWKNQTQQGTRDSTSNGSAGRTHHGKHGGRGTHSHRHGYGERTQFGETTHRHHGNRERMNCGVRSRHHTTQQGFSKMGNRGTRRHFHRGHHRIRSNRSTSTWNKNTHLRNVNGNVRQNQSDHFMQNTILNGVGITLKEFALDMYRRHLKRANQQWMEQNINKLLMHNEKQRSMCKEIKERFSQSIKNLIIFILIVKKENEFLKLNNSHTNSIEHSSLKMEVILQDADLILTNCLKEVGPQAQYEAVIKHLDKISNDHSFIMVDLNKLKQLFIRFHKITFSEERLMLENISKFWTDTGGKDLLQSNLSGVIDGFKTLGYSEQAKLMHSGNLGTSGYVMSNLVDGLLKCHLKSEETKQIAVQGVMGALNRCFEAEAGLLKHIQTVQASDQALIEKMQESLSGELMQLAKLHEKLLLDYDNFLITHKGEEEKMREEAKKLNTDRDKICDNEKWPESIKLARLNSIEEEIKSWRASVESKRKERHEVTLRLVESIKEAMTECQKSKRHFIDKLSEKNTRDMEFNKYYLDVRRESLKGFQDIMNKVIDHNSGITDRLGNVLESVALKVIGKDSKSSEKDKDDKETLTKSDVSDKKSSPATEANKTLPAATESVPKHVNGGQAQQGIAVSPSLPSWKADFDSAGKDYAEGKSCFYMKKDKAGAYTFFQQAKDKYKLIADQPNLDAKATKKIQKRLGKFKNPDGKYSQSKLSM